MEWVFRWRTKDGSITEIDTGDPLYKEWVPEDEWDAEHPRDDSGRFTSGGGSGGGRDDSGGGGGGRVPEGATSPDSGEHISYADNPRVGMGDIKMSPGLIANLQNSTAAPFMDEHGNFTPERQALHDQIVSQAIGNSTPVEDPRMLMMGGGPASGKSEMTKSGLVDLPDNAVHNDPDAIKNEIPEVQQMQDAGDKSWAGASHEESSYISARVTAAAYESNRNLVLDSTGDSTIEKLGAKIDAAHDAGFKVEGNYITVHPDVGVQRAMERADKTGRLVRESVVRDTYQAISDVFPEAATKFDSVRLFDNNTHIGDAESEGGPRISQGIKEIASASGGALQISDPAAYKQFLSYGSS